MNFLHANIGGLTIIEKPDMMRNAWFLKDAEGRILRSGVIGMGEIKTPGADQDTATTIAGLEMFFERKGEDSMERFERIAAEFRRETGFLRPGKDCITHEPEVRQAAYDSWIERKLKAARDLLPAPRPAPKAELV